MLPPAPARFSTTKAVPNFACMCWARMRAIKSVEPPAANGTTTLTCRCGQPSCACAGGVPARPAASTAAKTMRIPTSLAPTVVGASSTIAALSRKAGIRRSLQACPRAAQLQCERHSDGETAGRMSKNRNKWIGQSVQRLEDPPLVIGRGRFAGDISFPHQLHMRIVRSNHAHGKIVSIDVAAARALPGVFAVWTAADIADIPPVDFREGPIEKLAPYRQPVLATERVRYVGDPVAAVFAEDAYVAEDAADLVTVDVEELPVVLAADDEPVEFSPGHDSEAALLHQGYGDVEAAMRAAHTVVELELAIGRHTGVPLE